MPRKLSPDKLLVRLLENSGRPVYLLDAERRIAFANEALARWLGQPLTELIGARCDFSAAPHEDSSAATAPVKSSSLQAALGPPPEVFQGTATSGYVVAPVDGGKVRATEFLPVHQADGDDGWHVLAVVHGPPVEAGQLDEAGGGAKQAQVLHARLLQLRQQWGQRHRPSLIIGASPASQRLREQIELAARGARCVLVVGPQGSGREHVARTIHYGFGEAGPLVPIECPLVDAESMQAALTAFVKQQAKGKGAKGAILLVDVDRLKADAQNELAEFLQLPGMELTIRATARRSLLRLAAKGRFRRDLAYTLSTLEIVLPPLAQRADDVPLLAQHFVEQYAAREGKQLSGFAADALDRLAEYDWPGNIEELEEIVQAACARAVGPYILDTDLPDRLRHAAVAAAHRPRPEEPIQLDEFLAGIERELMERAMKAAKGNKTKAAELLGIHRARLIRRLVQLGLAEPPTEPTPLEEPVIFEPLPDGE